MFSKRIFATNRAAIGRIWTILRGSKAGPRGHILGPPPAPGGAQKTQKKKPKHVFCLKILNPPPVCLCVFLSLGAARWTPCARSSWRGRTGRAASPGARDIRRRRPGSLGSPRWGKTKHININLFEHFNFLGNFSGRFCDFLGLPGPLGGRKRILRQK